MLVCGLRDNGPPQLVRSCSETVSGRPTSSVRGQPRCVGADCLHRPSHPPATFPPGDPTDTTLTAAGSAPPVLPGPVAGAAGSGAPNIGVNRTRSLAPVQSVFWRGSEVGAKDR